MALEHDELQIKLLGPHGRIDARGVQRALANLLDMLEEFDDSAEPAHWIVSRLQGGSVGLAVRPAGTLDTDVWEGISVLTNGIEQLEHESGVPEGWDERALRHMIDIARVAMLEGVEGVELSWADRPPVRLDHQVLVHSEESLTERHMSLGSVRGVLDRYIHRKGRREVGLIDEVTGQAVKVQYPAAMQERVVAAMEHTVTAWGELHRNYKGQKVRLRMEDFEVEDVLEPAEPVEHLAGALGADWTGGHSSVDWVRNQRDGS